MRLKAVFSGTGPGEAELGLVGSNYFTLPARSYPQYYRYQYVEERSQSQRSQRQRSIQAAIGNNV